jgi:hypothetical protein
MLSLRKLIRESMNSHIVINKDCIQIILLLTYLDVEMIPFFLVLE